jgi:ribonuclease HI
VTILIAADASLDPLVGIGGWGAVITYKHHRWELGAGAFAKDSTALELQSIIEALRAIPPGRPVTVYNDCQAVVAANFELFESRGVRLLWRRDKEPIVRQAHNLARQHMMAKRDRWVLNGRAAKAREEGAA